MAKKSRKQKKERELKPIKKRGFFGTLFHLIFVLIKFLVGGFLVSMLVAGVIGFFIYSYYPIQTFNFCINNTMTISNMDCTSNSECLTKFTNQSQQMPDIIKNFMSEFVICNKKCEIRMLRILDQSAEACKTSEEPRQLKIYIKEIIPPEQIIPVVRQFVTTGKLPFSQ